jgi:Na+-transporting NADH:ubiquinone oxidoreductase subunit B
MLRQMLDRYAPLFHKGGKLEAMYPLYDAVDTFLYTPATVTATAAHVRDGIDLKRLMSLVVVSLIGPIAMALYNTGYQAHRAIEAGGDPYTGIVSRKEQYDGTHVAQSTLSTGNVPGTTNAVDMRSGAALE